MIRYPKTPRLPRVTDELAGWRGLHGVVEEKVDGANAAVSFEDGELVLQSRGHILRGGRREALFAGMWPWAYERLDGLREALGERYVAFGEWCHTKGRMYYDALPDWFIEFDVWDREAGAFLSTARRRALLEGSGLVSVAVLWEGLFHRAPSFSSLIGPSRYKTERWRERYLETFRGLAKHYARSETEETLLMEGVYVKVESGDHVVGRIKVPRGQFEKVRTDDAKWGRRPLFPNRCRV